MTHATSGSEWSKMTPMRSREKTSTQRQASTADPMPVRAEPTTNRKNEVALPKSGSPVLRKVNSVPAQTIAGIPMRIGLVWLRRNARLVGPRNIAKVSARKRPDPQKTICSMLVVMPLRETGVDLLE